ACVPDREPARRDRRDRACPGRLRGDVRPPPDRRVRPRRRRQRRARGDTVVTDNGGPFRSFRFEAFITAHPELRHVRTRVRTPGQNGSRERGFGSLKYERLFLEEIDDVLSLVAHADDYRAEYNTV